MKKYMALCCAAIILNTTLHAQSFAINTDGSAASNSAMLDIKSNNKGLLIPRLTKSQKNTIAAPATGLLIYQSGPDSAGFYYYQSGQWNWLTDNKKNDSTYWGLRGNTNLNPPPAINNIGVDPAIHDFFGTMEAKDLSFVAGSNELLRLRQHFLGGRVGLSNRNPEYSLDIRTTENLPNTSIMGMRIVPNTLFDFNAADNRDKGLIIGYESQTTREETIIWNFGSNTNAAFRMGLFNFDPAVRPALNILGKGLGIYQKNPAYMLDLHSMSNFAFQTPVTNKNGMRITYPGQENSNTEKKGLFMGVDVFSGYSSYIWNYANGVNDYSSQSAIYLGVGDDPDIGVNKPTMQIRNGMVSIGNITPNTPFPSVLNIQTQLSTFVTKNGLSILKHLTNDESVYFGTDQFNNLDIQKFGTGDISIDINNNLALLMKADGNFKYAPIAGIPIKAEFDVDTFRVSGILDLSSPAGYVKTNGILIPPGAAAGKVLTSDISGNAAWADPLSYWTLNGTDIYNNNPGNTGIGVTDPVFKLDVGARMRLRATPGLSAGTWLNNEANTASPAFAGMRLDDEVGYYGQTGTPGWRFYVNTSTGNAWLQGILTQASDARLKKNIVRINDPLQKLAQLNGYTYNWKDNSRDRTGQYGVLAQEVQKVFPELVKQNEQGQLSVNYSGLIPVLLEGMKEQNSKIDQQQKQIDEQRKLIDLLLNKLK